MRICIYNTPGKTGERSYDKIIWCPLSGDIVHVVRFFRKNYGTNLILQVESVFRRFFDAENGTDISFVEVNGSPPPAGKKTVAFYSQSDTLAINTLCLISENPDYSYVNYIPCGNAENADSFFEKINIPFVRYSYRHLKALRPDVLVLYNDWTKAAIRIIAQCHLLRIPVVCIQESIIDFGDSFRRMQHADDVMIQGVKSALMLPVKHFCLTGNPRYNNTAQAVSTVEYALINCNFTYNIYEEVRAAWLDDVTSALEEQGINYLISQHPRDNGDLSKYKNVIRSSGSSIDEQFGKAGLLITRFSSLIHESLIRRVPVVYYNPHNEKMHYDFDFNQEFLAVAGKKDELKKCISEFYKKSISGKDLDLYLNEHCLPAETKPVSNINFLLMENNFSEVRFTFSDFLHLIIYQPFILWIARIAKKALSKTPEPEN